MGGQHTFEKAMLFLENTSSLVVAGDQARIKVTRALVTMRIRVPSVKVLCGALSVHTMWIWKEL